MENDIKAILERAKKNAAQDKIVCLHALDQSLVEQLHEEIKTLWAAREEARTAIQHVLRRICEDSDVRYHLGAGTQSYDGLCKALSALTGEPLGQICDYYIRGSSEIHVKEEE